MFVKFSTVFVLLAGLCLAQEPTVAPEDPATNAPTTTTPAPAPKTTTTPAPDTTTTPAPKTTTTPTPDTTTTPAPNTTTEAPTTTTAAPVTTTAVPPSPRDEYYRVTKDNVTCMMFSGDFTLDVSYNTTKGTTHKTEIRLPAPSSNPTVFGDCGKVNGSSFITVQWGVLNQSATNFTLNFTSSGNQWELSSVNMEIQMTSDVFVDSPDAGKLMYVTGLLPELSLVQVPVNQSLTCKASVASSNFNASVAESKEVYTATAQALGFRVQAFNEVPQVTKLQSGMQCSADAMSDVVPIAVGCALAALVLLVLISYLVGRRRRANAYQSV